MIEGKGNGGSFSIQTEKNLALLSGLAIGVSIGVTSLLIGSISLLSIIAIFAAIMLAILMNFHVWSDAAIPCFAVGGAVGASITRLLGASSIKQLMERTFLIITGGAVGSQLPRVAGCI
ncbi:MAG: hypothetical protein EON54_21830 [Alcaligenaceae bacterium]|nr:MAG: hypothetical protein EON54_21830 [Alcaligenaceae bacterium]